MTTSPAYEVQRYKRCPTCQRLTPAESQRCYECWNDVAATPVLPQDEGASARASQTAADEATRSARALRQERWRRIRLATTAFFMVAVLAIGYRAFVYAPPPPPPGSQPAVQLEASAATWPIEGGTLTGTRSTSAHAALAATDGWTVELGSAPRTPLIAGSDVVFAALDDGRVVAVDAASGRERWTLSLPNPPVGAPTLAAGRLYIPQLSGRLLIVDASSGRPIIETPVVATSFTTSPMVADGVVYLFGTGELVAFDAVSGDRLWSQNIDSNWAFVTPVLSGPHIAVATGDRTLIFDRLSGQQTYFYEFERAQPYSIVLDDDTVYSLSARFGAAIDVHSQRPWWESVRIVWTQFWVWGMASQPPPPPSLWVTSKPPRDGFPSALAPDRALLAGNTPPARNAAPQGDLRAIARADGAPLWQQHVELITAAPTLTPEGLVLAHVRGLALYDINDGHLVAERPLDLAPGAPPTSVVVVSHGTYVLARDGRLFALR